MRAQGDLISSAVFASNASFPGSGMTDGTFQTLSTSFSTSEGDNNFETLGVKLTKVSGAGNSYLDFDNISFSESLTRYGGWQLACGAQCHDRGRFKRR